MGPQRCRLGKGGWLFEGGCRQQVLDHTGTASILVLPPGDGTACAAGEKSRMGSFPRGRICHGPTGAGWIEASPPRRQKDTNSAGNYGSDRVATDSSGGGSL